MVVAELQRLPDRYWEAIASASWEAEAGLALCGSSMRLARRVFERRSPLLGLLEAFRVDLAAVEDAVASLHSWRLSAEEAVLWAVLARDPWVLRHLEPRGSPGGFWPRRRPGSYPPPRAWSGRCSRRRGS